MRKECTTDRVGMFCARCKLFARFPKRKFGKWPDGRANPTDYPKELSRPLYLSLSLSLIVRSACLINPIYVFDLTSTLEKGDKIASRSILTLAT